MTTQSLLFDTHAEELFATFQDGLTDFSFRPFKKRDDNVISGHRKKARQLYDPSEDMRKLHRRVLAWLRSRQLPLIFSVGGMEGDSPLKHVQRHAGARFLHALDLKGAFESLAVTKIASALGTIDPQLAKGSYGVEQFLWAFCATKQGGLVTGAPSSTVMFNATLGVHLDPELARYCHSRGLHYSRYIDDLVISGDTQIGTDQRRTIRRLVDEAGFEISHRKSILADLDRQTSVRIHGIGLDRRGRTFVPQNYRNRLRGMLLRAWYKGDVDPNEIHGRMGVFVASHGHKQHAFYGREEQQIVRLYLKWKRRFEASSWLKSA